MPRSMWTGSIGFGMAHIPVKMYTAIREQEPKFKRWDPATKSYPRQVQLDANGVIIPMASLTKVYDTGTTLVELTESDLQAIAPESAHHMNVQEFVPLDSIDPLYIEKTYFLGPGKDADFAFALLAKALAVREAAGIVRVTMKTKEHLARIYMNRGVLCLSTMFYDAEVLAGNIISPAEDVAESAVDLACNMINAMWKDCFDAGDYRDEHTERILAMIADKESGIVREHPELTAVPPLGDILETIRAELDSRVAA